MSTIKRLSTDDGEFWARLETLVSWDELSEPAVLDKVRDIISQVRHQGDAAL